MARPKPRVTGYIEPPPPVVYDPRTHRAGLPLHAWDLPDLPYKHPQRDVTMDEWDKIKRAELVDVLDKLNSTQALKDKLKDKLTSEQASHEGRTQTTATEAAR